ncbi:hypothetical protein JCM15519_28260 [Fundidesulfovibrio butyratiphilus]
MIACPVCGGPSRVLFERGGQSGSVHMPAGDTVTLALALCPDCGFCFNRDAFADPGAFLSWLAPAYRSYTLLDNDLHGFPLVDERTRAAERFLDAHCPWPEMENVLEVGSNRGDFLAFLRQRHAGVHLLGVESSPLALVGVPTLFHDVRELRFSPTFDLVIARQVVEHVADPVDFTAHLAGFLRPGGRLFYELPLLENDLDEGVDPFVVEHVGFWSERSLARLGARAGLVLEAVDLTYQMSALFRRLGPGEVSPGDAMERWPDRGALRAGLVRRFLDGVEKSQEQWRKWVEQGGEIRFYGASNVFLAVHGVLAERWGRDVPDACRQSLADDSPSRWGSLVGGLAVTPLEDHAPKGPVLWVVCAMYRYHRATMVPRVRQRMRPGDRLFTMWTELGN